MRSSRLGVAVFLLLPAGCGTAHYLAMDGTSPRPPVEVFDCVKGQIAVLGYTQTSNDVEKHRVTAQKYDWETRMADTQFRRMIDRLMIEVSDSADKAARLKIRAHTFADLVTQKGPTEIEQSASVAVRAAAQSLMQACGS